MDHHNEWNKEALLLVNLPLLLRVYKHWIDERQENKIKRKNKKLNTEAKRSE